MSKTPIPKIIWMIWLQGEDQMPLIVQECVASWRALNPTWEVRLLDAQSIRTYIDPDVYLAIKHLPPQHLSDIFRILLLEKYGGVWADASLYCAKPLDTWLNEASASGFFAFEKPRDDKLMSNWFMAARKDTYIVEALHKTVTSYWTKGFLLPKGIQKLYFKFDQLMYLLGMAWIMKKTMHLTKKYLGLFPYYCFHYIFDELYAKDETFQKQWDDTPKKSANAPHTITFFGFETPLSHALKRKIEDQIIPVHKLSWRIDLTGPAIHAGPVQYLLDYTKKTYSF